MDNHNFDDDRLDADLDELGVDGNSTVIYGVEDTPAPHMCVVFALQVLSHLITGYFHLCFDIFSSLTTYLFITSLVQLIN